MLPVTILKLEYKVTHRVSLTLLLQSLGSYTDPVYSLSSCNRWRICLNSTLLQSAFKMAVRRLRTVLSAEPQNVVLLPGIRWSRNLVKRLNNNKNVSKRDKTKNVPRWVAVCLGTHCNIGSKRPCCPLASDIEPSHVMSTAHLWRCAVILQTFTGWHCYCVALFAWYAEPFQ